LVDRRFPSFTGTCVALRATLPIRLAKQRLLRQR
jgi:hypothetical protein